MFLRPIIQAPPSKKTIAARRPSVVSFLSEQPTGIVCSQVLGIYQIVQSIFQDRRHFFAPGVSNEPRVSRPNNYPKTLNVEGAGFLTDLTEYEFMNTLLANIPSDKGIGSIKGATENKEFQMTIETRRNVQYVIDPKYIVGILFSVFPVGQVVRDFGAGHALSLVKVYGKWYMCDDNVGIALPAAPFDLEVLLGGTFQYRFIGSKIQYCIEDTYKLQQLVRAAQKNNPGGSFRIPEEEYITIVAEVPLKREMAKEKLFQEGVMGGAGGFGDMSFSRKYVCWQPAAPAASAAAATAPLNENLRALASRYGIYRESVANESEAH
jgi:hypothetical protein